MISGFRAETPLATMRASGVMPSCLALVSLMTITAAAPSLSGQALPAVTVPPSRKTGFSWRQPLEGGAGPGAVVLGHHGAVGQRHRDDLALEEAVLLGRHGPGLGEQGELVHLLAGDLLVLGHVLGRLAHGDVDVGQALGRASRAR